MHHKDYLSLQCSQLQRIFEITVLSLNLSINSRAPYVQVMIIRYIIRSRYVRPAFPVARTRPSSAKKNNNNFKAYNDLVVLTRRKANTHEILRLKLGPPLRMNC